MARGNYKCKKIVSGEYIYRGFRIKRYPSEGLMPNRKWVWEAIDKDGSGFAHSHSLRVTMALIDDDLEKENYDKL